MLQTFIHLCSLSVVPDVWAVWVSRTLQGFWSGLHLTAGSPELLSGFLMPDGGYDKYGEDRLLLQTPDPRPCPLEAILSY